MIRGIGIDIVSIVRFDKALKRWGRRFSERLFTKGELDYCMRHKDPARPMAVRFAAKEALMKALGGALKFKDIEVVREKSGRPILNVKGGSNGYKYHLSLSHEKEYGVAHVVVEEV